MTDHKNRRRPLTREQREERFSTGGKGFTEALRAVLAGGRDESHKRTDEEGGRDDG